jgi:hypothetical protein
MSRTTLALLGLCCLSAGSIQAASSDNQIIIRDVTVISPERDDPLPHTNVIIRGERINQVGGKIPAG